MFKTGQKVLVTAQGQTDTGAPGFVDGDITISADNGAVVEKIDGVSANVTLAAGTTNITGAATVEGVAIAGAAEADAADGATKLNLTVTAAG